MIVYHLLEIIISVGHGNDRQPPLSSDYKHVEKPCNMLKENFSLLLNQCPGYVGSIIILTDSDPLFPNSENGFEG
jgi:hypothetical protein